MPVGLHYLGPNYEKPAHRGEFFDTYKYNCVYLCSSWLKTGSL